MKVEDEVQEDGHFRRSTALALDPTRPEIDKGKLISFPSLSKKEEGLIGSNQQALVNQ